MRCARRGVKRAVLDPSVLVSALITPTGTPAKLLPASRGGSFERIVSPLLLDEPRSVLRRKKFRGYVDLHGADRYVDLLRRDAAFAGDPAGPPPIRCRDPDDDYLIAWHMTAPPDSYQAMTTCSSLRERSRSSLRPSSSRCNFESGDETSGISIRDVRHTKEPGLRSHFDARCTTVLTPPISAAW
jgi:predicted nucleic acid-binding protein